MNEPVWIGKLVVETDDEKEEEKGEVRGVFYTKKGEPHCVVEFGDEVLRIFKSEQLRGAESGR